MISGLNIKKKIFENYNYLYKSFLPEKKIILISKNKKI